jgi:hypothetical protein
MVERRDIELAIRARDLSTGTLTQATRAVRALTGAIEEQAAGVARGDTSLEDLRQTYRQLEQAAKALAGQQGLIDQFQRQTAAITRYQDVTRQARQRADEFRASLASKAEVSARAEARMQALEGRAKRVADALKNQQGALERTGRALEKAGIDTADLGSASQTLLTSAQQVGAGLTSLNTVMSGYSKTVRQAREAEKNKERAAEYAALSAEADRLATSYGRLGTANVQLARTQARAGGGAEAAVLGARGRPQATNLTDISAAAGAQAQAVQDTLGKPVLNYLGLLEDLERSLRSVQGVAKQVDGYQAQANAVRATREEFLRARENLRLLQEQQRRDPTPQNAAALRAQLPVVQRTKTAFLEQLASLKVLREELKQAGVNTRDFGGEQTRLVALTRTTNDAIKQLNTNFAQFGGSRREGPAGFLGLRPYELQNLSFQINDLFTQIASGTSITQAFAQQAGQIAQIQPIWTRLVAFAPAFVALGSAFAVLAVSVSRLTSTNAALRTFSNLINTTASGGTLGATAQSLTAIAREGERLGLAFADSQKVVSEFFREGLSEERIRSLIPAVRGLALSLGEDGAKAAERFTSALNGSLDDILRLDNQIRFLTVAQRQNIVEMFRQGDAANAQRTALDALEQRYRGAANVLESEFTRALRDAKNQFLGLADEIASGAVGRAAIATLQTLAGLAERLASGLRAARGEASQVQVTPQQAAALRVQGAQERVANAERAVAEGGSIFRAGSRQRADEAARNLPRYREELAQAQAAVEALGRAQQNQQRVAAERNDERTLQRGREFISQLERETAAQRAATDAERKRLEVRRAGELAVERATREGVRDVSQIELVRALAEEAERRQQQRQGGGGGGVAAVRRGLAEIQRDLQDTIRIRDETVRGIQEDVAAGALSPVQAIERIQQAADQARPALVRLAEEARRFQAQNEGRGGDSVRASAFARVVAQAERAAGAGGARAGTTAVLNQSQQEIRRILGERQQIIQTNNALEQQGVITRAEGERRIVEAYERTNEALRANIDAYEQATQAAAANGAISANAAALNAAQIEGWRASLVRINPELARLKQGIENVFAQSAGTFIDSLAKATGDLLAGVTSLEEAWEAAGQAALQFFADVLKGIAQVIIQEQVLIAVRAISKALSAGVAHSGGTVGALGGRKRDVSPAWFAAAPRLHDGTLGLKRDEYAAILQRGEEVLSRDDPRNIMNRGKTGPGGGSGDGGGVGLRQVLAIGDSEIANAMSGAAGEQVFMTFLQRNSPTVRAMLKA